MKTVLITGASGFVGAAVRTALRERGWQLRLVTRSAACPRPEAHETIIAADLCTPASWGDMLQGVDCVIHLAARTHQTHDTAADPLAEYRINVQATHTLAQAAVAAGVQRFVFASSIKVNGEATTGKPYSEADAPCPEDHYGITKREAEHALRVVAASSSMQTVILRPPLMYGPGVKGNFLTLVRAVARGVPLPLASLRNRRSLLGVANLAHAIAVCVQHPAAAGKTYLVADNDGLSTPDLVRAIALALGKTPRLLPCPAALLVLAGRLTGKSGAMRRLVGSLQIDSSRIRNELGWQPQTSLAHGLAELAGWYDCGFGSRITS